MKKFKEGDRVAVHNTAPCGHCYFCKKGQFSMCEDMLFNRGSYAEYVKVPGRIVEQNMFKLDDTISHKTASLMEPFSCAVYGIDNCPIQQGDTVIVNGAGPIGLMFARLAVLRGGKVIVSDMKENRLETARKLGVWKTVNLTGVEDAVAALCAETENERGADVVIEATGLIGVWETSVQMARKGGFILLFGGTKGGSVLHVDATLLHYSQVTIKGVFHTTPLHVSKGNVVIVGGGYIGLEIAEACVLQKVKSVRIVEALDQVLNVFDEEFGQAVKDELEKNDVAVCTGERVQSFEGIDGTVTEIVTDKGRYPADIVILSIGVSPNTKFIDSVEKLPNGAIITNTAMETSVKDVYAAGDCGTVYHKILKKPAFIALGTYANKQGRLAGDSMIGKEVCFDRALGTSMLRCLDGVCKKQVFPKKKQKEKDWTLRSKR